MAFFNKDMADQPVQPQQPNAARRPMPRNPASGGMRTPPGPNTQHPLNPGGRRPGMGGMVGGAFGPSNPMTPPGGPQGQQGTGGGGWGVPGGQSPPWAPPQQNGPPMGAWTGGNKVGMDPGPGGPPMQFGRYPMTRQPQMPPQGGGGWGSISDGGNGMQIGTGPYRNPNQNWQNDVGPNGEHRGQNGEWLLPNGYPVPRPPIMPYGTDTFVGSMSPAQLQPLTLRPPSNMPYGNDAMPQPMPSPPSWGAMPGGSAIPSLPWSTPRDPGYTPPAGETRWNPNTFTYEQVNPQAQIGPYMSPAQAQPLSMQPPGGQFPGGSYENYLRGFLPSGG